MAAKKDRNTQPDAMKRIAQAEMPNYINSTTVARIGGVDFKLDDVLKTALMARMNIGLLGDTGMGKTQLEKDIMGMFGAKANYVLGRNDLDIKQIFRKLNFKKLQEAMTQGGEVDATAITNVTSAINRPLVIVDEINRCVEAVQNQLFNIFDGYMEIDGNIYPLGLGKEFEFTGPDGKKARKNLFYTVGICSANLGNGKFTGTSSMDRAMKDRLHLTLDVDNFSPGDQSNEDLDAILLNSSGEVRTKSVDDKVDLTEDVMTAYHYLTQASSTLSAEEVMYFRYLVKGLDYIPVAPAGNSKRKMKEVWLQKAEEDNIGTNDDDKIMYRMVFPASVRGAQATMHFARALREYAKAKDPEADPTVLESVMEAFKLVGAYSGIIENHERLRNEFCGNPHIAMNKIGEVVGRRLENKSDLIQAIVHKKAEGKQYTPEMLDECKGEFECFK